MKNTKKEKGFTLIELLVTIAVLTLILSITAFVVVNVIKNSKEKSYQITIDNIESKASTYYDEMINSEKPPLFSWVNNADASEQSQFTCVTVEELINAGFFSEDILKSEHSDGVFVEKDDFIYLKRDSLSKTLKESKFEHTKTVGYVDQNNIKRECEQNRAASGNINFEVLPAGFSKYKDLKITYKLDNEVEEVSKYVYYYKIVYDDLSVEEITEEEFDNKQIVINRTGITKNGDIYAYFKNKDDPEDKVEAITRISGIDTNKPSISYEVVVDENNKYIDSNNNITYVKKEAIINLSFNDIAKEYEDASEIADVDYNDGMLSFLDITIDGQSITEGIELKKLDTNKVQLTITNSTDSGELEITVGEDFVKDNAGNGSDEFTPDLNIIFDNEKPEITINNPTGGNWTNQQFSLELKTLEKNSGIKKWQYTYTESPSSDEGTDNTKEWVTYDISDDNPTKEDNLYNFITTPFKVERNGKVYIRAIDNVGNISDVYNTDIKIDTTPPEVIISQDGTNATFNYEDKNDKDSNLISKVEKYYFGTTNPDENEVEYTTDGITGEIKGIISKNDLDLNNTYYFKAIDHAGNGSDTVQTKSPTYTITYKGNAGTDTVNNLPKEQTKNHGETINLSSNTPTRTGYDFLGWDANSTATEPKYKPNDKYSENASITLYAIWQPKYTIRYFNGNTEIASCQNTVSSGTQVTINCTPTKAGYTLIGWSTSQNSTAIGKINGVQTINGNKITLTSDVKLYAVWSQNTYTLNYYDGNSLKCTKSNIAYGEYVTIDCTPTKAGYTLDGWSTTNGSTTATYKNGSKIKITSNTNLYAVWKKNYTLKYYNKNGLTYSEITSCRETVPSGSSVLINCTPTKSGYYLKGWATSQNSTTIGRINGVETTNGNKITLTNNVNLYAIWGKQYIVTYDANGGTGAPNPQTINGTTFTVSDLIPYRDGYVFDGWYTGFKANGTGIGTKYSPGKSYSISSNLTLYAKWLKSDVSGFRYSCLKYGNENFGRFATYSLTSCNGDVCYYNSLNHLSSENSLIYDKNYSDNTYGGLWTITGRNENLKGDIPTALSSCGSNKIPEKLYVLSSNGLNCRNAPSTTDTTIKQAFLGCTQLTVYPTTTGYNAESYWYYYYDKNNTNNSCYLSGAYLSTNNSSCYVQPTPSIGDYCPDFTVSELCCRLYCKQEQSDFPFGSVSNEACYCCETGQGSSGGRCRTFHF